MYLLALASGARTGSLVTLGSGALQFTSQVYKIQTVNYCHYKVSSVSPSLIQSCPLPVKALERISSLPQLVGPTTSYQPHANSEVPAKAP